MIRRFVSLVAEDYATGARSLHRLDVAKHLFYPSTARAEAAAAKNKEKEESHNGAGNKVPRRRIGTSRLVRELPPPTMSLQRFPFPAADKRGWPQHETFALLGGSDGSRILHAGEGGQVVLYDADAGSTTTLPDLAFAKPEVFREPLFISIADAGAGTGTEKHKESVYVITDRNEWNYKCHSFKVLDLSQLPHSRWENLPPPPFITRSTSTCSWVRSFAVLDADGGTPTICASMSDRKNKGTYCFDTRRRKWWRAGDWTLPFHGRAEYVPELHNWLGSCQGWWHAGDCKFELNQHLQLLSWPGNVGSCFHDLCSSSDLSAVVSSAMDARGGGAGAAAPTLQHVWQDTIPDDEEERIKLKGRLRGVVLRRVMQWVRRGRDLINLGGGRFCVANFFRVQRVTYGLEKLNIQTAAEFVELGGVEIVHCSGGGGDNAGELQMVKHKSRRYMFTTDEIKCVL